MIEFIKFAILVLLVAENFIFVAWLNDMHHRIQGLEEWTRIEGLKRGL